MDDFNRRFEKIFAMVTLASSVHLEIDAESAMLWGPVAHLNVAHAMNPGAQPADLLAPDGFLFGEECPVCLADLGNY